MIKRRLKQEKFYENFMIVNIRKPQFCTIQQINSADNHRKTEGAINMNITDLENNTIYINGESIDKISNIKWDKHPKFSGVFTKTLLTSKNSSNNLSAMIVKIDPLHEIGDHIHEGKYELHEILSGDGIGTIEDKKIEYKTGVISLIPGDIHHSIKAGDNGMILLAKFTPPLN